MVRDSTAVKRLKAKYGSKAVDNMVRLHPRDFTEQITWRDEMDPQATRLLLDYTYGGLYVRGVLDDKTRLLCVVDVCTALDEMPQNENHIRNALMLGAIPREVMEVTVQSTQYWGMPRSLRAMSQLENVLREQGRLAELTETQLPLPA